MFIFRTSTCQPSLAKFCLPTFTFQLPLSNSHFQSPFVENLFSIFHFQVFFRFQSPPFELSSSKSQPFWNFLLRFQIKLPLFVVCRILFCATSKLFAPFHTASPTLHIVNIITLIFKFSQLERHFFMILVTHDSDLGCIFWISDDSFLRNFLSFG